jgi:hypothetical protein
VGRVMHRPARPTLLVSFAALATFVSMSVIAASSASDDPPIPDSTLDDLDRCVQHRFVAPGRGFGFSRMAVTAHNIHRFVPRDDSEAAVVGRLQAEGTQVVMYLASRQRPRLGPQGSDHTIPPVVQGPVLVYPAPPSELTNLGPGGPKGSSTVPHDQRSSVWDNMPVEASVRAEAIDSLRMLTQRGSKSFQIGTWKFVARPVPASASSCLNCHNRRPNRGVPSTEEPTDEPFRLGDPIGAVLYGYRPLPQ